jgi:hypothetical protein
LTPVGELCDRRGRRFGAAAILLLLATPLPGRRRRAATSNGASTRSIATEPSSDRALTQTSDDGGGVLFIQVPPGDYLWTAHKPGKVITRVRMKCRAPFLVNASPPWGLQTH